MSTLARERCFNHGHREAAGRCSSCGRFFCRECLIDHEERLTCSVCLAGSLRKPAPGPSFIMAPVRAVQFMGGVGLLWLLFYYLGLALSRLPSSFHDPTLWGLK